MSEDPVIHQLITREAQRQIDSIELIASENFVSQQIREATGSVLTNKYAEGLPKKRYYGGCKLVDEIEDIAIDRAKQLFNAAWVNVQPHSGAQANAAVMMALLNPGDRILGFGLAHGGHLTHGSPVNFSGRLYQAFHYGTQKTTGRIAWDEVEQIAKKVHPKLLICGASSYSRDWDYARLRKIADQVAALLMEDISLPAGLMARGLLNTPLPHCHIVTTTTHKTLRGPRGGMILVGEDFTYTLKAHKTTRQRISNILDKGVFPGMQGGPLMHVIAAKAIAFQEALSKSYLMYVTQVQKNAREMARCFLAKDYKVVSNGTDNHLILVDLSNKNLTGKVAEAILEQIGITVNKNMVPFDTLSPSVTSGIRLGSAAMTTRGMKERDMAHIVTLIDTALTNGNNPSILDALRKEIQEWVSHFRFPISTLPNR